MKRILAAAFFLFTGISTASAGIVADMRNFYSGLGMGGNITPGGVYQGQAGGYFTGGGMFVRAPQRSYQLLSITPPSISSGCGGIDLYLGGFSFINKAQFTSMLRNIGNNAVGYAFNLALQTFAPQIYSTMQDLQRIIQKVNQASVNSCHTAQMLVNGLAGVMTENSAKGCQAIAMAKGLASDYKDAERYCQSPAARRNIYYGTALTPQEKDQQNVRKNLLWAGLNKETYTGMNASIKELLMSLVGTYVVEMGAGAQPDVRYLPPTTIKLEQMVNGTGGVASAEVYRCSAADPDCLHPTKAKIALDGYRKQVEAALDEIRLGLTNERLGGIPGISAGTKKLLTLTRLPVLKMMTTAVALGPSVAIQVENELVEPVAFDLVALYLDWAYRSAEDAARQAGATAPKELWQALLSSVSERSREFRSIRRSKSFMTATRLLEQARFLDQTLVSQLTPHMRQVLQYARSH